MIKEPFKLRGTINRISDIIHIKRLNKPDIYKKTLTITTLDNQKLLPEIRNKYLKLLERENIEVNSFVEITYIFAGSEKNGKTYNNIHIINITKT